MTHFPILITSDIVCPWCYIGHTRLTSAITSHKSRFPNDTFALKYLPFYLNPPPHLLSYPQTPAPPPFPVQSVDKRASYASKFGAERAVAIEKRLISTAASEGLTFTWDGKTGPSRNGHRLVYYAQTHGGESAQNDVMLGLWKRYYTHGVDITQLEVLVEVGVEAGLGQANEVREWLESGKGGDEVDRLAEEQRSNDIGGVPNYIVCDTWEISGAQEGRVFESLFLRWKEKMEKEGNVNGVEQKGGPKADACL